ncbi:hypothetical protein PPSIR1_09570 [Plesiocystis pacifica SIR-1]|uniref:Uncharacterized protein n=1 Tax=Plesiocystis pacifica SIR-1 TaxID=391625 RepID=A6G9C0_9BACT|nr:hypothetical protein [Plesiocystis pacifica]EDM77542.1 hypothetical protein PPSIR1_09570 [Plesiocystis pacifica SIR-1]
MFLFGLTLQLGCRPPTETDDPELRNEESLVGSRTSYEDEDEDANLDASYGERPELPALKSPEEKCKGKGDKRTCEMVDPQPDVTAAHGARKLMGRYRWGMDVRTVMAQLEKDIEDEYAERQAKTTDAVEQDKNREWKREQIAEIAKNHVKFEEAAHHRWGVSLIGHEFVDNEGEEMVWVKTATLKKFYFFKDDELYKIIYAYGMQAWPGQTYQQILDDKFKKWFGVNPERKAEIDEETQIKLIDYVQWDSRDNDRVRAFDMTAVHGAFVVSVVSGEAEERYGVRLPTRQDQGEFSGDVADVLGGSDICYDEEGNMIEDEARCEELRGY